MIIKNFLKTFFLFSILLIASSCDKDFNTIGSDVVADEHFGFNQYLGTSVVAFNNGFDAVQTNNLPVNSLGIYNNSVFGKTRANYASQLELAATNIVFEPTLQPSGTNGQSSAANTPVTLDSVVLTIPYFDRLAERVINATGAVTYKLDSIQGSSKINLKVFENKYIINDLNPLENSQEQQKYFSNQDNLFDSNKGQLLNDDLNTSENTDFLPSAKEYIVPKRDNLFNFITPREVEVRQSPRINLHLNKDFFLSKIINAPTGSLASNTAFKNYFRGLYFQVADAPNGSLMKLNFAAASITMYWKEFSALKDNPAGTTQPKVPVTFDNDNNATTPEVAKWVIKTFVMNLRGNSVNLINQTNTNTFQSAITAANATIGDEKLWIKGGANGAVALIDLFGPDNLRLDGTAGSNGVPDDLDAMRRNKWLINEANLVFHVDKSIMANDPSDFILRQAPYRVYLYDAVNNFPLIDYATDVTVANFPKFNKFILGGILAKNNSTSEKEALYKIRITSHVRNLVSNLDAVNVRLGLSVTEFIGITNSTFLQNSNLLTRVPVASTINQKGTVLFGNTSVVPAAKKLRLEIYYTKPN
ncbi:MAG: hypothetical protein RLZZ312_1775 [Bacteroidota bacterium]|jgi:hypothetical protein